MPSSHPEFVSTICAELIRLGPDSLLDVGCGNGKWGFLAREYMDVYRARWARDKQSRIDAIEIFEEYDSELLRAIYSNVYIGDALEVLPTLGHYDAAVCGDMLEHLPRDAGERLLGLLTEHCEVAWVTTPVKWFPSRDWFGNEAERHRELWTAEQLGYYGEVITGEVLHLLTL